MLIKWFFNDFLVLKIKTLSFDSRFDRDRSLFLSPINCGIASLEFWIEVINFFTILNSFIEILIIVKRFKYFAQEDYKLL